MSNPVRVLEIAALVLCALSGLLIGFLTTARGKELGAQKLIARGNIIMLITAILAVVAFRLAS
jgi:hypothetical protein